MEDPYDHLDADYEEFLRKEKPVKKKFKLLKISNVKKSEGRRTKSFTNGYQAKSLILNRPQLLYSGQMERSLLITAKMEVCRC